MLTTAGREKQEQMSMMLSNYGRGRLLAYADSFRELSRSYRGENPYRQPEQMEGISRQQVLEAQRLWENRQMLCNNLDEMSQIMAKIAGEVFQLSPLPLREERLIIRALKQEGITVRELFYMEQPRQCDSAEPEEERGMAGAALGLHMQSYRMIGHSSQEIADMLSVLLGRRLIVSVTSPSQIEGRRVLICLWRSHALFYCPAAPAR